MKPDGDRYGMAKEGGQPGFRFQDRTAPASQEDLAEIEQDAPEIKTGPLTFDEAALADGSGEEYVEPAFGDLDLAQEMAPPAGESPAPRGGTAALMAGLKAKAALEAEANRQATADAEAAALAEAFTQASQEAGGDASGGGSEGVGGSDEVDDDLDRDLLLDDGIGLPGPADDEDEYPAPPPDEDPEEGQGAAEALIPPPEWAQELSEAPVAASPDGSAAPSAPEDHANGPGSPWEASGEVLEAVPVAQVVERAPKPRTQAPKPRTQALEVKGLSLEPVVHEDPRAAKVAQIQKSARDMTLILAGLMGVPPKGAQNAFAAGLLMPGAGGVKPVSWSPESARVEQPHSADDRLPAHDDDNPVQVIKKPEIEPDPYDPRMDEDDVDALLGSLDEPFQVDHKAQSASGKAPGVTAVPPETLPTPRALPPLPSEPVGGSQAASPLVPIPARSTPPPGAPPPRREGPGATSSVPVIKAGSKSPKSGPSWTDMVIGGAIVIGVAVGLSSIFGRSQVGEDGMRRMAFSDRMAIQVYLDDHLARIERRLTEVEGDINTRARAAEIQPKDIGRMEGLARERAGLALLREAVLARRRLLGIQETKGKDVNHG